MGSEPQYVGKVIFYYFYESSNDIQRSSIMYYKCLPVSGGTNLLAAGPSAHCFYLPAFPVVTTYFQSLYV